MCELDKRHSKGRREFITDQIRYSFRNIEWCKNYLRERKRNGRK